MKAAVLYQQGELPVYTDIAEPVAQDSDQLLVTVKAVAIKHFDRNRAAGKHYSSNPAATKGKVIGGDGVCLLPDGTRVYGMGASGMLAEKALIEKDRIVKIPSEVPDSIAAALPNAVIGAAMALRFKAGIQPGDTVLINGATGFTGRVAVQLARHYGAAKVIATGRNPQSLKELLSLGADEVISLQQDDASFMTGMRQIHSQTPIDITIDYLWGHPAEMILSCLKGNGSFTHPMRYVSVGSMSGDIIQLSAANLRSANIQLTGSGLGAWTKEQVGLFFKEILPEAFQLAAEGKLIVETTAVALKDIAQLWDLQVPGGKRLVVTI